MVYVQGTVVFFHMCIQVPLDVLKRALTPVRTGTAAFLLFTGKPDHFLHCADSPLSVLAVATKQIK
jgi:hypothetical protein